MKEHAQFIPEGEIMSSRKYQGFKKRQESKGLRQLIKNSGLFDGWYHFLLKSEYYHPDSEEGRFYAYHIKGQETFLIREGLIEGLLYQRKLHKELKARLDQSK